MLEADLECSVNIHHLKITNQIEAEISPQIAYLPNHQSQLVLGSGGSLLCLLLYMNDLNEEYIGR